MPNMIRTPFLLTLILLAGFVSAKADILYDGGRVGTWGGIVKPETTLEELVQPFWFESDCRLTKIGVGLASGADPNHIGFTVSLVDTYGFTNVPGKPLGNWNILPTSGPTLAYSYIDIDPIQLKTNRVYALLIRPGDDQMYGSVAYTLYGQSAAWGTHDGWATKNMLSYPTCIRLYGDVPEPSTASSIAALIICSSAIRRRVLTCKSRLKRTP